MMAAALTKFPVWFIFCVVYIVTFSAGERNDTLTCVDGTYDHDTRTCCLCAAGQLVKEHCTTSQQYGKCEHCDQNMYNSQPTSLMSCEPCTSCSQPNANLEVKQSCTPASDTKCQCKKDHYCSSGTETCRICNPCQECPEGIKVPCTSNNNTVCNDKIEGVHNIGVKIGVPIVLIVLALIVLALFCLWKRYWRRNPVPVKPTERDVEMEPLAAPIVDLQPHMSDIARIIGWGDMQDVARRSNILNTVFESCQRDHPNNSQEQTINLLHIWVEQQGMEASKNLIEILQNSGKRLKAQQVTEILSQSKFPA